MGDCTRSRGSNPVRVRTCRSSETPPTPFTKKKNKNKKTLTHFYLHRLPSPLRQSRQGKTPRQTSRRHRRDHHERQTGPAAARRRGRRSRPGHRRPHVPEEPGARVDVRRGAGGAGQRGESDPVGVRRAAGGGEEEGGQDVGEVCKVELCVW